MKKICNIILITLTMAVMFACSNNAVKDANLENVESSENVQKETEKSDENNSVASYDAELAKEKEYWASQPLDVSSDGSTCYVLDYYGGQLDEKYLKFKKIDFSKNHGKHIKSVRGMLSLLPSKGDYPYQDFYGMTNAYTYEIGKESHFSEDLSNTEEEKSIFHKATFYNLEEVDMTGLDLNECEDMSEMFAYCSNLKKVNFANANTKNVKSMYKMFHRCVNLETIENFNINTSNVEEMHGMFYYCKNLKNVDFSSFTADNLLLMNFMFYKCESLENINLNKFKPEKCVYFNNSFMLNKKLKSIDLSNFKTPNGQDFSYMFYGCESLESLDLSSFDMSSASNLEKMFYSCKNVLDLNVKSFRFGTNGEGINMKSMFEKIENIKSIDISSFSLSANADISYLFRDCYNVNEIDMTNIDVLNVNAAKVFDGCGEIKNVKINNNINIEENLGNDFIKQINFVRDYEANHAYCERRNKIYNRELININAGVDGMRKFVNNEFAVIPFNEYEYGDNRFKEFFEIYEENKYDLFPNFVTTDSMLHTYHLYFDFLMKKIEKEKLSNKLIALSKKMYQVSSNYSNLLKNSEWEKESIVLKAYFAVPLKIFDENFVVDEDIKDLVNKEISMIEAHSEARPYKPIFEDWAAEYEANKIDTSCFRDDYTQFKPRGHYDGDETLEKYFKVFMWFGRTNFKLKDDHLTKIAILMAYALNESGEVAEYNIIKNVIYYFAGESDDRGPVEYISLIEKTYGSKIFDATNIIKKENYDKFKIEAGKLKSSKLNSGPGVVSVENLTDDNAISFRFIGQTYTYDAEMFKRLIYDFVKPKQDLSKRYLPDFLDVPASLNSKVAENILKEAGNFEFPEYATNLRKLQNEMPKKIDSDLTDILYVKWIKTLKRLVDNADNDAFPSFMKNDEWKKKTLETFGGSYAELKHDTILYAKQTYAAEMGEGGMDEFYDEEIVEYDDKGYVEPEADVYMELYKLANDTLNSFSVMDMLDKEGKEFLGNFAELAMKLYNISNKELNGQSLTEEDYDLIRGYGGIIEHLITDSGVYVYQYADQKKSNAIVADIATGANFALEIATGNPIKMYVIVEVDGKYKICSGGVYDFYQFTIPAEDRMTDKEWRVMMGFEYADAYNMISEEDNLKSIKGKLTFQDWTNSYRQSGIHNGSGHHLVYKIGGDY